MPGKTTRKSFYVIVILTIMYLSVYFLSFDFDYSTEDVPEF